MARKCVRPIASFVDASRARRHLWVVCRECGQMALIDPRNLIEKLGELLFEHAGRKLRCARRGCAGELRPARPAQVEHVVDRGLSTSS